jgi:alpha-tubulin suppressor-like RCC1 family protein
MSGSRAEGRPTPRWRSTVRLAGAGAATSLLVAALWLPSLAAASAAGDVFAFGSNGSGELGSTGGGIKTTPALVSLPGQTGPVIQVSSGSAHSLVLTASGQLYAFGDDTFGQLGDGDSSGSTDPHPDPTLVTLPGATGPVTDVAAGSYHSLAVTSTGQLYGFGDNAFGQLGNTTNDNTHTPNPTPALISLPSGSDHVTRVAAGDSDSYALTSSGQLYTFGDNVYGQLGRTATGGANPAAAQLSLPSGSGPVTQVAAGAYHGLVLTAGGQIYGFGNNHWGDLGNDTNVGTDTPNPTPTLVSLPVASGLVAQVAAGAYHSLVVTADGQLYAFGDNYDGELGNSVGNTSSQVTPTPTLVTLPGANGGVVDVAGLEYGTQAITATGQLYAFGNNQTGQLGKGTPGTSNPNPTPALVALPPGTTIEAAAGGVFADHSLAIVSDLAVASAALPGAGVGASYNAAVQAAGGVAPYRFTASGLPPGLSLGDEGVISGSPGVAGKFSATIAVRDAHGIIAARVLGLSVAPAARASLGKPHVSGNRLTFALTCGGLAGQTCRVKARLSTVEKLRAKRILSLAARKRAKLKRKTVTVASRAFTIAAGKRVTARLTLNRVGKRLLKRFHRLPAKLTLKPAGTPRSRSVKFAAKRKKHKHR